MINMYFFFFSQNKEGVSERKKGGRGYFVYCAFWGYVVCISLKCLDWIDVFDKGRKSNPNRSG